MGYQHMPWMLTLLGWQARPLEARERIVLAYAGVAADVDAIWPV